MEMAQKDVEEEEENKEKDKTEDKDIAELEAEADKLVEDIAIETDKITEKVKIKKLAEAKTQTLTTTEKVKTKEEIKKKELVEENVIENLIKTYKWAYKENLYPWMYWIPEKNTDLDSWLEEWSNFLFDWAKEFVQHIVDLYELATKRPFNALQDRDLALHKIMENLARNSKFAKWINDEKTRLRIYWQSLDKWGEILYDWAFLVGEERLTLLDLREQGTQIANGFETLPAKDLKGIIDLLVKSKKAIWIDKKSFKFLFDI